jgi:hypothetical protein
MKAEPVPPFVPAQAGTQSFFPCASRAGFPLARGRAEERFAKVSRDYFTHMRSCRQVARVRTPGIAYGFTYGLHRQANAI